MDRHQRIINLEERAGRWLADGNEAMEKGEKEKAEKCYQQSQYWLDRATDLRGWGDLS